VVGIPSGCAVESKLATGRPGVDISQIVPGVSRAQVEAIVGTPVREWTTTVGVQYRLYRYDAGVPPDPESAALFGIFDVMSLGIWSIASSNDPDAVLPPSKQAWLAVSYESDDRVRGVFAKVTEFSPLPEDGRSRSNDR